MDCGRCKHWYVERDEYDRIVQNGCTAEVCVDDKPILDACCGSRMFWFDKQNEQTVFCDNRQFTDVLCDGRTLEVNPDVLADFRTLPFDDECFWHVVFDPPHLIRGGENSWLVKKYGKLPKEWREYIKAGFDECWRVLKTNGTLVFKWNEYQVNVSEIIKAIDRLPLYGQKGQAGSKTHWMVFVKGGLTMDEKLKNCPFCGGGARIDKWDSERWVVVCKICHVHTNPYSKAELAISAWNRRVEG